MAGFGEPILEPQGLVLGVVSFGRYSGSRIAVPGKHAAKWHFLQENATFITPEKGHMNSGTALVHASSPAATLAGAIFAQQEGEHDEHDGCPTKLHVDILVALHAGLILHLIVDLGHG